MAKNDHASSWLKGASGLPYDGSGNPFSWQQGKDHHDHLNRKQSSVSGSGGYSVSYSNGGSSGLGKLIGFVFTLAVSTIAAFGLFLALGSLLRSLGIEMQSVFALVEERLASQSTLLSDMVDNESIWIVYLLPFFFISLWGIHHSKKKLFLPFLLIALPGLVVGSLAIIGNTELHSGEWIWFAAVLMLYPMRLVHARRKGM